MKHSFHKKHSIGSGQKDDSALLRVEHLAVAFDHPVLADVSLEVHHGETLAVLGKSGTGKSVLLKLIVGLLHPDAGKIYYRNKDVTRLKESELMALRSDVGFVFQGAALFDSMTVGQNLDLYLVRHTELTLPEREQKIIETLEMVGLKESLDKMPSELSGGMKKRAGLARSIVIEPELMLYDEPTTGLDPLTAAAIAEQIVTLQQNLGISSIVVTHDLPTAFTVADRAVVLNEGQVVFDGPLEGLTTSTDPFLHEYLGASRLDRSRRDTIMQRTSNHSSPSTVEPLATV